MAEDTITLRGTCEGAPIEENLALQLSALFDSLTEHESLEIIGSLWIFFSHYGFHKGPYQLLVFL